MVYTAAYKKIQRGYMGQILEWPEVITEGKYIEECRLMLKDALYEMTEAYKQLGRVIPDGSVLLENIMLEPGHVVKRRDLAFGRGQGDVLEAVSV